MTGKRFKWAGICILGCFIFLYEACNIQSVHAKTVIVSFLKDITKVLEFIFKVSKYNVKYIKKDG